MTNTAEGVVVRADARLIHVDLDPELRGAAVRPFAPRGKLFEERGTGIKNPVTVGDRVRVSLDGDPPGVEEVLPRTNYLPRIASSHDPREQILFANVDQLFVIGSVVKPTFSSNRTDRILATCEYYEIPARLILNKVDLDTDGAADHLRATYEAAGIPVLTTCAIREEGLPELAELMREQVTALYGASGAGKSTILNHIQPELKIKTGKISRYWEAGKHTTTYSRLHWLPAVEGWVIDTPGIRVFRLAGINKAELRDCFPEFTPFQEKCHFPDCSHDHEPDCAVFAAVEEGELAPTRYASYVEILDELVPPPPDDEFMAPPDG